MFQNEYRTTKSSIFYRRRYLRKFVLNISKNQNSFPALSVSNNFATNEYDAHFISKINFTINHVFCSMTVQELITLHIKYELECSQLLTILVMLVQNPQFTLLVYFMLKASQLYFIIVHIPFHQYAKLIAILIAHLYITRILLCIQILLLDNKCLFYSYYL